MHEEISKKYQLVVSNQWREIREHQLNNIVRLSSGDLNPLVLQGMLLNIAETDRWQKQYELAKKQQKE